MKSSANTAAASTPLELYKVAKKLDERSAGIACKGLQHAREYNEGAPDYERLRPSEAEHQSDNKIADKVVNLPAKSRTRLPFRGPETNKYDQDQCGHAANF